MAEIGSQDHPTIGANHKNSIKCFFPSVSLSYSPLTLIYVCLGTRKISTHSVSPQINGLAFAQRYSTPTVNVIKGSLQPVSVPPGNSFSSTLAKASWSPPEGKPLVTYGNNPLQSPEKNLAAAGITRTVGGMASHWTCACRMSLIGCSLFLNSSNHLQSFHSYTTRGWEADTP